MGIQHRHSRYGNQEKEGKGLNSAAAVESWFGKRAGAELRSTEELNTGQSLRALPVCNISLPFLEMQPQKMTKAIGTTFPTCIPSYTTASRAKCFLHTPVCMQQMWGPFCFIYITHPEKIYREAHDRIFFVTGVNKTPVADIDVTDQD